MFNAEQMENTENLASVECFKPIEADRVADGIVKASPCPVIETPNDEAFYLPGADKIYVPQRNQFTNVESFCRTLLHEIGPVSYTHLMLVSKLTIRVMEEP